MSIRTGLRTHLLADGDVGALIGTRMYPNKLPQNPTYPSLTYEIISDIPYRALDGDSDRDRTRARIHCWASTSTGAWDLATKVRASVADFSGLMGATAVSSAKFENWYDQFEDVPEVYQVVADFFIAHT